MSFPDGVLHLLVGLNADQYAAEMQAQLAHAREANVKSEMAGATSMR
jgi:hypothetical protein